MAFPCDPCPQCPRVARGLPLPCPAMASRHARYCELVAMGRADYAEWLCRDEPAAAPDPAEAIRLRRAAKPRVPLGTRPPAPPGGD